MLEDGHLERAVLMHDDGNTRRPVRLVGLVLARHQAAAEVAVLADRVGLVAVRHNEVAAHRADGVIDDEARVGELGGVKGLGADAVVGLDKDAVAAVLAAAHDEIIDAVLAD